MEEERIGRDQLIFSRSFATPITAAAGIRQVMSVSPDMNTHPSPG
jgi:DNA polymerase V